MRSVWSTYSLYVSVRARLRGIGGVVIDGVSDDGQGPDDAVFQFDSLLQPEFARAPQPYYRRMRATNPVLRTPNMYGGENDSVFVARHGDVEHVLRNPGLFSSDFVPVGVNGFPLIP